MLDGTESIKLSDASAPLPLSRFKVLDLTLARAGPSCVRTLADWGADVIRIEPPPGKGKNTALGNRDGSDAQNLHRNKRAMTLDLKSPRGREIFMLLAKSADVLVENMRPGVAKRLGVDYEAVKAVNPRIVYGSISGFGQYGPYAERPSLDQIAQGMTGIMSVTGLPDQGPVRAGIAVTDLMAGALLAQGLLIALLDRETSGQGRWVQTSLVEAGIGLLDFQATRWLIDKQVPPQEGNFHPTLAPMGLYPTADGYLNLAATSNLVFRDLCSLIGRDALPLDERFATPELRAYNKAALNPLIAEALRARNSSEWFEMMVEAGIPCGPVFNISDVFADQQVQALRLVRSTTHARLGKIDLVAQPIEMTGCDRTIRLAAPELGEHTDEILRSAGFGAAEIDLLKSEGVV